MQRVSSASVVSTEAETSRISSEHIGRGVMLLVGFSREDTEKNFSKLIKKLVEMRIFPGPNGSFDQSLREIAGEVLLISQFTLYADVWNGRRPEFFAALEAERAAPLFDMFCDEFRRTHSCKVARGVFGASMQVTLTNDGPVSIVIDH